MPADPSDRSPAQLERDMEETRARLEDNLGMLLHQVKPSTVARKKTDDLKGWFVAPDGTPRTENVLKAAGGVVGFVAVLVVLRRITR